MSWPIQIPKIDANVTRAIVVKWLVRDGDHVTTGTPLVEIETEKAVFEIESQHAGVVHVAVEQGQRVPIGAAIGIVADPGEPQLQLDTPTAENPSRNIAAVDDAYIVEDYQDALLDP